VIGPEITFIGVARADDTLVEPTPGDVPIYTRVAGAGFSIIVEGRPGLNGTEVGQSAYDPSLSGLPDLQIVASRALGNGSGAVCDRYPPEAGGVPAVNPPRFDAPLVEAINDFACRFVDGNDQPEGRNRGEACVLFDDGGYDFVRHTPPVISTVQYCGFIDAVLHFPPGDTLITARLLDVDGNPGPPAQIIVRVAP
jgi:hypothetical protein